VLFDEIASAYYKKYINILALEMAIASSRHCASCIGTLSFRIAVDIKSAVLILEVGSIGR